MSNIIIDQYLDYIHEDKIKGVMGITKQIVKKKPKVKIKDIVKKLTAKEKEKQKLLQKRLSSYEEKNKRLTNIAKDSSVKIKKHFDSKLAKERELRKRYLGF